MIKLLISILFTSEPSCEDVDRFLVDYIEGTLDEATVARFDAHIEKCKMCREYVEQYRQTITLTSSDAIEVPEELVSRTLVFLRQNVLQ